MTDWIEHNGGPQPVADGTWVRRLKRKYPSEPILSAPVMAGPYDRGWKDVVEYQVLNQHLIDAARLEGIRLGLEAAAGEGTKWFGSLSYYAQEILANIRALDPETIARDAADKETAR